MIALRDRDIVVAGPTLKLDRSAVKAHDDPLLAVHFDHAIRRHILQHEHSIPGPGDEAPCGPGYGKPDQDDDTGSQPGPVPLSTTCARDRRRRIEGALGLLDFAQVLQARSDPGPVRPVLSWGSGAARDLPRAPPARISPEVACVIWTGLARENSGSDPGPATPDLLKNGVRARATSLGSWKRCFGSLAIILATTAASSTDTSGLARCSGVASAEWCAGGCRTGWHVGTEGRPSGGNRACSRGYRYRRGCRLARIADLLGGDVTGVPSTWPPWVRLPSVRHLAPDLGQPEIKDHDQRACRPRREHQVARLDVPVDHAMLMGVLQGQGRLMG